MGYFTTRNTCIKGVVSGVPENTEDNLILDLIPEEERESLVRHTGIRFRKIVEDRSLSIEEFFHPLVEKLLEELNWEKESIDVLICVTQNQHNAIPSVACKLHELLNLEEEVFCYDINSGCSGFVYGLYTVNQVLSGLSGNNARAVLCCGDISSFLTEKTDKAVRPVFSDAVSVVGIEKRGLSDDSSDMYFNLETFGKGRNAIYTETGKDANTYMRLNGIDIFNYSVKYVPENVEGLLDHFSIDKDDVGLCFFHQANKVINEAVRKKLSIPVEKTPYSLYDYGNTASASIPVTIGVVRERLNENSKEWTLLSGFGVGFSIASVVLKLNPEVCFPPFSLKL